MKPEGGEIRGPAPLFLASLLLHLVIFMIVSGSYRSANLGPPLPMMIDYLDSDPNAERTQPEASPRAAAPQGDEQMSQPMPALAARPAIKSGPRMRKQIPEAAPVTVPVSPARMPANDRSRAVAPTSGISQKGAPDAANAASARGSNPGGEATGTGSAEGSRAGSITGAALQGKGSGATSGTGSSGTAGNSSHRRGAYRDRLKSLIEAHKEYPFAARRARQEGSCLRRFVLSRNGAIKRVEELSSCGYGLLNEAATRAITAVGSFPPLPDEFKGAEEAFTVPLTFTLDKR